MSSSVSGVGGELTMYLKHCNGRKSVNHSRSRGKRVGTAATDLKRVVVLLLLFVDDAEPEVYFVCLVEVWLHVHDVDKRIFSMV